MGTFIYSICLEFIILALCAYKLPGRICSGSRSQLVEMLFQDGLVYFVIVSVARSLSSDSWHMSDPDSDLFSFFVNLLAAVIASLQLNPIMSIMVALPACITSVVRPD